MSQAAINHRVASLTAEAHRNAYNAAFEELSLNWRWDATTYACWQLEGRDLLRTYLQTEQPHLLRAYDADFLVNAIEAVKARWFDLAQNDVERASRMMPVVNDPGHNHESCHGVAA